MEIASFGGLIFKKFDTGDHRHSVGQHTDLVKMPMAYYQNFKSHCQNPLASLFLPHPSFQIGSLWLKTLALGLL